MSAHFPAGSPALAFSFDAKADGIKSHRSIVDSVILMSLKGFTIHSQACSLKMGSAKGIVAFEMPAVETQDALFHPSQCGRRYVRLSVRQAYAFPFGKPQLLDEGELASMPAEPGNVAAMYAALRDDVYSGTSTAPDSGHAVHLARLIHDALLSAQIGDTEESR